MLVKDNTELQEVMAKIVKSGAVPEMLDAMRVTQEAANSND